MQETRKIAQSKSGRTNLASKEATASGGFDCLKNAPKTSRLEEEIGFAQLEAADAIAANLLKRKAKHPGFDMEREFQVIMDVD